VLFRSLTLKDLELERVVVLYPGTKRFPITERVDAVPLQTLADGVPLFAAAGG